MNKKQELINLIMDMSKTLRCCQQDAEFCESITLNQFFILDQVAKNNGLRLSDLHALLAVEKSTTTRLVDPLVKMLLVTREKSSEDSRATELKLTANGKDVHKRVHQCLAEFACCVESHIPQDKREQVFDSVKMFLKAIKSACNSHCHE